MTFNEASRLYLNAFGEPDQSFDFHLADKIYKQWYWYKLDVIVEFAAPKNNRKTGWNVSFALSLDPLRYHKKDK
jgi:hypothetical protein